MSGCFTTPYANPGVSACYTDLSGFVLGDSPPASFFNIRGIVAQRFVPPAAATFDSLYSALLALDPSAEDPFNSRTADDMMYVRWASERQFQTYRQQISLFQYVYQYNLTAYNTALANSSVPVYYKFNSQTELTNYRAAVGLIAKLYNIWAEYPVNCLFFLPFPPWCGGA